MKASNQLTILNIEEQTYEDICTHDTTTGLIECTHAQDQGCVRVTELQGKSEQAQSTLGKNLLDLTHAKIIVQGTGFTYTIQNSNAVTLNCTNPGAYSSLHINLVGLTTGKSYSVSGVQSGKNITLGMDEATDAAFVNRTVINGSQVTVREGYFYKLKIYANINSTSSTETYTNTYTNIQLEEGSTATAYEPFIPNSPSPDYPSVINSIGDSGKLNVVSSVGRRNLLLDSGRNITTTTAYNVVIYETSSLKPNTKYTFVINGFTNSGNSLGVWFNSGLDRRGIFPATTVAKTQYIVVTTPGTLNNTTVNIFNYPSSTATNATINWACMYEGEIKPPLEWTPAPEDITPENSKQYEDKLSLATVNLTSPLRSLPNGTHDVLEYKDWVWGITRNVGKIVLNGSETWAAHNYPEHRPANTYVYYIVLNNSIFGHQTSICSHFKNLDLAWDSGDVGTYSDYPTNARKYFVSNLPTIAEFKTWLSSNNITMSYPLETPIWEPLDDTSQKALNNLLSYSGKDYIYTTDPLATNFSVAVKSRAFYENFKLQEEIKNTNSSLGDLDDEIKGGFYDGIINVNEAEAIRKAAETMHTQVTNQFNKVDSNPSLTGTPKTTHQTKYTECNNAYNTLISKINTAIDYCSVNSTKTDTQKKTAVTDMNTAFGAYKTKLADYQKAYQDAIDAIAKKKADDAVDGVVIGGRNLLLDSGRVITLPYYNVVNYKTSSLKPNTKYTVVLNGYCNAPNKLGVWFNSGYVGGGTFPATTVTKTQYIVVTTPTTLNHTYVNVFNHPQSTATSATINWACMYEGEIKPPLDWTPAPEDADEKINQVSATLTSTITDVKHTVDKNTKSITDKVWKSDIITGIKDLNVGGVNLWDLSAIKRYASGSLDTIVAGTSVDAKTGKITVTADPQAVPGCKIDVSTLTRNSSNIGELVITGYFDRSDSDDNKLKNVYLYYRCFNNANAEIQAHTNKLVPVETSSNLFAGTLSIPANTAYINFGVGQIPYVKPYTLTGITVKDSALYDITKGLRDQVSQAHQDINGFKQTVSDTYTTKTEFDNLQVSAKNLARGTTGELRGYTPTTGTNSTFDYANVYTSGLKVGDTVTLAIDVEYTNRGSASGQTHGIWFQGAAQPGSVWTTNPFTGCIGDFTSKLVGTSGTIHLTGKAVMTAGHLKYEHFNFGVRSDYSNGTATYKFKNLMVVRGEKEMDWTPAPEDIDKKFTNYSTTSEMNSKIEQTKKAIELGVSQTYTSKSEGDKITQGLNKWILEVYQLTSSSMPNPRVADIENIRGKVPTKIIEVADTAMSASLNVGDYYIGHAFTYLYFDAAYTWSGTIKTDEEGVVYLNGVKKVSTATGTATNISLPFQAGWNVLEVVYNEGTSNDGWLFSSKFSALSQCKIMNCYAQVSLNASALIKVTADAISQKVENDAAYAEFTEQAGKMAWLVKSGTAAANMELTPEALNVIADKINLTGKVTFSSLATDAKKKIEEAEKAGTDAQTTANQAVSNTVLTPADKIALYATFLDIQNEYSRLKEQCTNLGVTDTLKTSYDALYALLNGIVGTTTLQNSNTTGFNKSNYDALYKNYVTTREVLEQAQITKVYEYTNTIKEHFTTDKALAVANWFASQDKTMIDGAYIYTGTVTAKQIAANSIDTDHLAVGMNPNLVRYGLDTMEQFSSVPYFTKPSTTTILLDDSQYYIGTKSIKLSGTTASNYVHLGSQVTDYGCIPVVTGKKYILSCYVKTSSTTFMNVALGAVGHTAISTSSLTYPVTGTKILRASDGWVRCSAKFTATSDCPYISMRINVGDANTTAWFDAFQIEEVDSEDKEPGSFKQAGTTIIDGGNITTGIMKSANYNYVSGNFAVAGTMIDLATGVIRSKGFGMDSNGNSYFNGTVTATTLTATTGGKIAGWNIKNSCLWKGSSVLGSTGKSNIYLGDEGISFSDKFIYETETGELEINGKILASSGQIGGTNGFNIKEGAIWRGSENWGAAGNGNIYLGVDGFSLSDKLKYKDGVLEVNGVVNATSGSIGGWNITTGSMNRQFTANGKNYWLYFDTGTTSDAYAAFMLRTKATTASAWEDKFSIAWNGKMTAMDADVRGVINATSLQAKDTIQMYSALTSNPATILQLVKPGTTYTYDVLLLGDGLDASSYFQFQRHAKFTNGAIISAGGLVVNNNISASEIYASQHHISSYDGGWFMQDSTWVRSIGNKSIYTGSQIMAGNAIYEFGTLLSNRYQAKGSYSASSHTHGNIVNGIYSWNISGTGNLIPRKNGTDTAANIGANSTTGCVDAVYYKSLVNKSDRRFKENIRDISLAEALTIVENLNIKSYNYKDDKAKIKNYGILGQELRDLLIESSHELFSGLSIDDRYEEGRPVYDLEANEEYVIYGVNYTQFIPLLIKAMQYVLKEIHKDKKL